MTCINGFFQRLSSPVEYPVVRARLYVNEELRGELLLLVDTGAGMTSLSYKDALRLGLYAAVRRGPRRKVVGVSGTAHERVLEGEIVLEIFDEEGNVVRVKLDRISLAEKPQQRGKDFNLALQRPSILGWDALRNMAIVVDYGRKTVQLCLHSEREKAG